MRRFENKTVIVTGGGGGIGGAACRRFGQEGARVAVFDLNPDAAHKVAAEIRQAGGRAEAFDCDITRRTSVDTAVAAAEFHARILTRATGSPRCRIESERRRE